MWTRRLGSTIEATFTCMCAWPARATPWRPPCSARCGRRFAPPTARTRPATADAAPAARRQPVAVGREYRRAALLGVWRRGPAARSHRRLRGELVRRLAAHTRDWHPHGAWGDAVERAVAGAARGLHADAVWCRRRAAARMGRGAVAERACCIRSARSTRWSLPSRRSCLEPPRP